MTDGWTELGHAVIDVFKNQPGVLALMIVVGLLFKLLYRKDQLLQETIEGSKSDTAMLAKMLTLLEVLVGRRDGGQ
jgi:hypothetical protein